MQAPRTDFEIALACDLYRQVKKHQMTGGRCHSTLVDPIEDLAAVALARQAAVDGSARRLRISAGLSLADVAAVVGADRTLVAKWEKGLVRPSRAHASAYGRWLAQFYAASGRD